MNPTPDAMTWIDAFAAAMPGGWGANDDAAVVSAANAPAVANPAPQGAVPVPFTMADVLGALSTASEGNLRTFGGFEGLRSDVNANDLAACVEWCAYLPAAGVITQGEATAILAIARKTQPDPSYQSQIGRAAAALGRPLDADDAATTRARFAPGTKD